MFYRLSQATTHPKDEIDFFQSKHSSRNLGILGWLLRTDFSLNILILYFVGICISIVTFHAVFQSLLQKVEDDLGSVKAYGASLTAQLNSLRMVPTLFGVINFQQGVFQYPNLTLIRQRLINFLASKARLSLSFVSSKSRGAVD